MSIISPKGGHQINGSLSKETREKIRKSKIGKKRKPFSEEHKLNLSKSLKGRIMPPVSLKTRSKMSGAHKGLKHSEETKKKIGQKSIGRITNNGQKFTDETKQKMSESHKGLKHSLETKQKMSESHKNRNKN